MGSGNVSFCHAESVSEKGKSVEPLQNNPPDDASTMPPPMARRVDTRQSLPAKGFCWYCDKPLDSVKRFCGKECHDAFDEEDEFTK